MCSAPPSLVTACSEEAPLEPLEKEWLQAAARAHVPTLSHLLQQDPTLATKKDFTSTALHWAAKHGKEDLVALLLGAASAGADVNVRAGYTPLHIAALHGHQQLMDLLVWTYGAKQDIRDHSGHLAGHYLCTEESAGGAPPHAPQLSPAPTRSPRCRNRKLACLLLPKSGHHSRRRWGSTNDVGEDEEEEPQGGDPHHLALPPASYRPVRKFSR